MNEARELAARYCSAGSHVLVEHMEDVSVGDMFISSAVGLRPWIRWVKKTPGSEGVPYDRVMLDHSYLMNIEHLASAVADKRCIRKVEK